MSGMNEVTGIKGAPDLAPCATTGATTGASGFGGGSASGFDGDGDIKVPNISNTEYLKGIKRDLRQSLIDGFDFNKALYCEITSRMDSVFNYALDMDNYALDMENNIISAIALRCEETKKQMLDNKKKRKFKEEGADPKP